MVKITGIKEIQVSLIEAMNHGSNAVNEVFERNKENYDDIKEALKVVSIPGNGKVIGLLYPVRILSLRETKLDAGSVEQAEATINTILNNVSPDISDIWWDKNSLIDTLKDGSKNFAKELSNGKEYFKSAIQKIEQHWNNRVESDEMLAKNIQEELNNEDDHDLALFISTLEEEQAVSITNNKTSVGGTASSSPENNDASLSGNKKKDTVVNNAAKTPANSSETSPAPTAGNTTPEKNDTNLPGDEKEDTFGATTVTSTNSSETSTKPAVSKGSPEKNDTTLWSEHKGKIALGVVGLCAVGAVAAYVLAYPVVGLALTVLAAVILMGAGIAKVLEDPSVERTFTEVQR